MNKSVTALLVLAIGLTACGKSDEKQASGQVIAKVDGKEISLLQLNQAIKNVPNVNSSNVDQVRKQLLDKLIDQQIVLNVALEQKIDRSADVVASIEAAKREIIARAYLTNLVTSRIKPTPQQVKQYFDTHPELFSERKVYNLQDISLPAETEISPALTDKVNSSKSLQDIAEWLKTQNVKFGASSYSKPAEQMPLDALSTLKSMRDGSVSLLTMDGSHHIVRLVAAVSAPMSYEQAKPMIQMYLVNSEGQKLIKSEITRLKEKAKVEYVGAFSKNETPAPKPAEVPAKPAEKNNSHIEKGVVGLD
ncbi:EpsD family peptidyl-prolyl cis-trans isomerase [Methylovorus sp. MP688]|uniref:EpsD family peptidyl-prolyl cis-trans isomerase n=1 Tax=Methylovorus sp. (strain MP688) TaxID=887061 RepID=UPI0002FF3FE6|nr:EpsD family peptidyl-prolyl cis-trans isomerase [Methylovorus sp. MP688]